MSLDFAPVTVGSGDYAVCLYYFPAYKKEASKWACRLVDAGNAGVASVVSQAVGTDVCENPHVGLVIRVSTAQRSYWLTKLLKNYLHLSQRYVDAPQKNWFTTSPQEMLEFLAKSTMEFAAGMPVAVGDAVRVPIACV